MVRGRKEKKERRQKRLRRKLNLKKEPRKRKIQFRPYEMRPYHRVVLYPESFSKSQGFDVSLPLFRRGDNVGRWNLLLLYATLGLHGYYLLRGKKLHLNSVKKYNVNTRTLMPSYYITSEAFLFGSLHTFQTKVSERKYSIFHIKCTVARLVGEKTKQTITDGDDYPNLPELPQENPFVEDEDGTNRFYMLKDSELQRNDWIRLYLELAVRTTNRNVNVREHSLTNLKILKVAMESSQGLGDDDAVFYIRYEDSCAARVRKDVHRVAIVRRILDKQSQVLTLLGRNQSIYKSDVISYIY